MSNDAQITFVERTVPNAATVDFVFQVACQATVAVGKIIPPRLDLKKPDADQIAFARPDMRAETVRRMINACEQWLAQNTVQAGPRLIQ